MVYAETGVATELAKVWEIGYSGKNLAHDRRDVSLIPDTDPQFVRLESVSRRKS